MFRVVTDVCLEQNLLLLSGQTTTIDEILRHMTNFRYVRIGRNVIAIGQDESWKRSRVLSENLL